MDTNDTGLLDYELRMAMDFTPNISKTWVFFKSEFWSGDIQMESDAYEPNVH